MSSKEYGENEKLEFKVSWWYRRHNIISTVQKREDNVICWYEGRLIGVTYNNAGVEFEEVSLTKLKSRPFLLGKSREFSIFHKMLIDDEFGSMKLRIIDRYWEEGEYPWTGSSKDTVNQEYASRLQWHNLKESVLRDVFKPIEEKLLEAYHRGDIGRLWGYPPGCSPQFEP